MVPTGKEGRLCRAAESLDITVDAVGEFSGDTVLLGREEVERNGRTETRYLRWRVRRDGIAEEVLIPRGGEVLKGYRVWKYPSGRPTEVTGKLINKRWFDRGLYNLWVNSISPNGNY